MFDNVAIQQMVSLCPREPWNDPSPAFYRTEGAAAVEAVVADHRLRNLLLIEVFAHKALQAS
jgi:hypothetical protein